jgi:hypothetical protein
MEHGVSIAILVSFAWIVGQNLLMHLRPAKNRLRIMCAGYLVSLPFVFLAYRWIPPLVHPTSTAIGLFHGYFFHLLLFLCYVECFYHIERSVTFRLLVELLHAGQPGLPLRALQAQYSVDEMVAQRLEVLREKGFLDRQGDDWSLRPKGLRLARVTATLSWIFQSKGQHERD